MLQCKQRGVQYKWALFCKVRCNECAGDFWHLRGSLPVEPLNAVLRAMDSWKVPMLMLVGNHDQVRDRP